MRFCKLSRQQIAANMDELTQLVAQPEFICQTCARVANTKSNLCKGKAFVSQIIQENSIVAVEGSAKTDNVETNGVSKKSKKLAKKESKLLKKQLKLQKKLNKITMEKDMLGSRFEQLKSIDVQALH
ncbi:hypothetical protein [Paraferrimonas sp. SM1919]|uniref:hypothetical protein n=1 Tax=Paraferrimonas sp. SM1919 TaxID=2662263 RepID=UPI0013D67DFD|nr:hypothetical protein [Paraferrimonas sp. SM1919]